MRTGCLPASPIYPITTAIRPCGAETPRMPNRYSSARCLQRPVLLSDSGDNTTAGAAGGLTLVLEVALDHPGIDDLVVAGITAPRTVASPIASGVGQTVEIERGAEYVSRPATHRRVASNITALPESTARGALDSASAAHQRPVRLAEHGGRGGAGGWDLRATLLGWTLPASASGLHARHAPCRHEGADRNCRARFAATQAPRRKLMLRFSAL